MHGLVHLPSGPVRRANDVPLNKVSSSLQSRVLEVHNFQAKLKGVAKKITRTVWGIYYQAISPHNHEEGAVDPGMTEAGTPATSAALTSPAEVGGIPPAAAFFSS